MFAQKLHKLSKEVQQIPLDVQAGALIVDVINFEYIPPDPAWVVLNHQHSSYEFHFISRGKGSITMDQHTFSIEGGHFYMTGPYVQHSQRSDAEHPMDECSLQCQIRLDSRAPQHEVQEAKQILKLLNRPVMAGIPDRFGGIDIFFSLLEEMDLKRIGYVASMKQMILQLIIAAVRSLQGDHPYEPIEPPLSDAEHTIVRSCILFLEDHYQEPITLDDAASSIYLSPRHLGRVFKTVTGSTVLEYLTEIRITRARQLLEQTDCSLEHIAQQCGIANGSYLSTLFKKYFGQSPGRFRKSLS